MKNKSAVGKRVRLVRCNDPYTDLLPGAVGNVEFEDDAGTLHVRWDSGHSLGLCADDGDVWVFVQE